VVLVVTLGKSTGASTIAAGLAVTSAASSDRRVVLAELDPAGGDLTERIVVGGWPSHRQATVPPGARQLADHLDTTTLPPAITTAPDPRSGPGRSTPAGDGQESGGGADGIRQFLVAIGNVPGLAVLLGDPLVGGARRAADTIGPALGDLVGRARFDTVVIDGGRWTSADPDRLTGVDLVYAVAEASTASQNHRCVAEAQSLWRALRARNPTGRLVVTVTRPAWPAEQLHDLYLHPPGTDPAGYRVVVLDLDRNGRHAADRLAAGRWAGIDPKGLQPFAVLARPIGLGRPTPPPAPARSSRSDEYAWVDNGSGPPPPPQRPPDRPTWPFDTMTTPTAAEGVPGRHRPPIHRSTRSER
jgi:hypothetical protein